MTNIGLRAVLLCAAGCVLLSGPLLADNYAYAASGNTAFGTIDLTTGTFTSLGNSAAVLAGLGEVNGTLFGVNYDVANGTLYQVNTANGSLTSVGSAAGVTYEDFGATNSGLYALSTSYNLYSINALTGGATLIGATGLSGVGTTNLSSNSDTLYFADGGNLYTINTSTGSPTLVGAFGGGAQMGALVMEGGSLYGGDQPHGKIDSINTSTGAATIGPASSIQSFYGLADDPISSVPEPSSVSMLLAVMVGAATIVAKQRRKA